MTVQFDRAQIAELSRLGYSNTQIAEKVGCGLRSVTRIRKELGLSLPRAASWERRISAERLQKAAVMVADGASWADIQRTLHVSVHTLRRHFPGTAWTAQQSGAQGRMGRKFNKLEETLTERRESA